EGYFWPSTVHLRVGIDVAAAEIELRGQIETGWRAGLDFTHFDTHMGAALLPELLSVYLELGFAYEVPVLLPRYIDDYVRSLGLPMPDEATYQAIVEGVTERGMPLVDRFRITPGYEGSDSEGGRRALYEQMLVTLPAGVTFVSLHPNAPGDIEHIVPDKAHWRTFEYELFQSDWLRGLLQREQIVPIGFRALRTVMRNTMRR
ncbi:MAG TPA: ChbG/HpnK family deacetylase, partial [Caldilineaceae bacterium]|nr:ChbG/HpnK family deacetylase [Caldilineaceae bacterium]